jgi:hypothetical protein
MEIENTDMESTEAVAEETEVVAEITEEVDSRLQEDINEWLDDKLGRTEEAEEDEEIEAEETEETETLEVTETQTAEVETEEEEKATPKVSKAFSRIAAKERAVRKERAELQTLRDKLKPYEEAEGRAARGDHIGALEKIGWSYENATNQVLQDGKLQTEAEPQQPSPEIEGRLKKLETLERQKKIDDYVKRLKTKVEGNDRFELVNAQWDNAWPTILEMQRIVANESGTIKADEEILAEVEEFYEQQTQQLAKSGKMKKLLGQTGTASTDSKPESPRTRKTLRNKISASQPAEKHEPRSRRERLEAALSVYSTTAA